MPLKIPKGFKAVNAALRPSTVKVWKRAAKAAACERMHWLDRAIRHAAGDERLPFPESNPPARKPSARKSGQ
jgi:hypothetical protein